MMVHVCPGRVFSSFGSGTPRRPCSDFMDMLRRLISCRIIIIIIIIIPKIQNFGCLKSEYLENDKSCRATCQLELKISHLSALT